MIDRTFEIRITRNDGTQKYQELLAPDGMCVATHIIVDIRSIGYQKNDPTIKEVGYNQKGYEVYRYA